MQHPVTVRTDAQHAFKLDSRAWRRPRDVFDVVRFGETSAHSAVLGGKLKAAHLALITSPEFCGTC
jgi:hypothetical protein